jgi:hypothetical protein
VKKDFIKLAPGEKIELIHWRIKAPYNFHLLSLEKDLPARPARLRAWFCRKSWVSPRVYRVLQVFAHLTSGVFDSKMPADIRLLSPEET